MHTIIRNLGVTLILFLAATNMIYASCVGVDPANIIRIGVSKWDGIDSTWRREPPEVWEAFELFLNTKLSKRQSKLCIRLVPGDVDKHLWDLTMSENPDIHGAILPPFRYVIATARSEDIQLLARMRRPDFKAISKRWRKADISSRGGLSRMKEEDSTPREHYRSIVVMRRNSGTWPPTRNGDGDNAGLKFLFTTTKSTSSFIFPMEYFRSQGWIDGGMIQAKSEAGEDDFIDKPWRIREKDADNKGRRTKELLKGLTDNDADFHLLGTNDERVWKYLPKEDRLSIATVYRSEPIPFDALVIRSSLKPFQDKEENIEHVRKAFLATRDMSPLERNKVFPWPPDGTLEKLKDIYPHRYPDIHDWVETSDDDYNVVRKAAIKATKGTIVRLAVSKRVHSRMRRDQKLYFKRVIHKLLNVDRSRDRVYLDLRYRKANELSLMSKELERNDLDVAELPAYEASKLVGKGFPIFGIAQFLSSEGDEDSYNYVIVTNKPGISDKDLSTDARYAYTNMDSSSGYRWPIRFLRHDLKLHDDDIDKIGRLDALGVMQSLLSEPDLDDKTGSAKAHDIHADYGFIAKFEYDRETGSKGNILADEQKNRLHLVDGATGEIPNAVLVMSPIFSARNLVSYTYSATPEPLSFIERLEAWRTKDSPFTPGQNKDAIASIKKHMFDDELISDVKTSLTEAKQSFGFLGYKAPQPADWKGLQDIYLAFHPSNLTLLVAAFGLVFVSSLGIIAFRYHHEHGNSQLFGAVRRRHANERTGNQVEKTENGQSGSAATPRTDARPSGERLTGTDANSREQIFFSYSHQDGDWLKRLKTMLGPAQEKYGMSVWDDQEIRAGDEWMTKITDALARAKIAVLLVSPDFLASDFVKREELSHLFLAQKEEGVRILWISLRSAMYEETDIEKFQALNDPQSPLDALQDNRQEAELKKIAKKILAEYRDED